MDIKQKNRFRKQNKHRDDVFLLVTRPHKEFSELRAAEEKIEETRLKGTIGARCVPTFSGCVDSSFSVLAGTLVVVGSQER